MIESNEIIKIFEALSQVNRLQIFRIMVEHSKNGITPTDIIKLMGGIPKNTVSFHLNALLQANLCSFEKKGKSLIYKPNCSMVKDAACFLLKDCCDGECKC